MVLLSLPVLLSDYNVCDAFVKLVHSYLLETNAATKIKKKIIKYIFLSKVVMTLVFTNKQNFLTQIDQLHMYNVFLCFYDSWLFSK